MKRVLVNISNHPSAGWCEKQKKGWDAIIDVPFPPVDPTWSTEKVKELALEYLRKINEIIMAQCESYHYIMLQGEFSFCYLLYDFLREAFPGIAFAIPTTKRIIEIMEDGSKRSVFQFVAWRIII